MKRVLVAATIVSMMGVMVTSLTAFAGKEEREYMKNDVMPVVKEAESNFKSSCGCALTITIDEGTVKTKDDMYRTLHMARAVAERAPKYCTDGSSKKALCQMKSLMLAKAAEAKFTFKGGKGIATTDGSAHTSFEMITRELDK